MKIIFLVLLLQSWAALAISEEEVCESNCLSQLVRMDIDNKYLQSLSTQEGPIQKGIQAYLESDTFRATFERDYELGPMPMPFNKESCVADKTRGVARYKDINCDDPALCSKKNVSEDIKSEVCFSLPCSMLKGSVGMSECVSKSVARPTNIIYTQPLALKKIQMTPTKVHINGKDLKGCFTVSALETSIGVEIDFDQSQGVSYNKLGLQNLNLELDSPREVCMSAQLDLTQNSPLSQIKIETPKGNFVSDAMINKATASSVPTGLTGYTPATLNILKLTGVPPMARHFRSTLENAVKSALASTFETQITELIASNPKAGSSTYNLTSDSVVSELGLGNIAAKKYVDLLDCVLLKAEKKQVPAESSCLSQYYPDLKYPVKEKDLPTIQDAVEITSDQFKLYDHVNSETLKARLSAMKARFKQLKLSPLFDKHLGPIINNIESTQIHSPLSEGLRLISRINQGSNSTALGLAFPKICNTEKPSAHEGHSIAGCPIQTYIDLDELNNVMKAMYDSGSLCHRGKGDYIPSRKNGQQSYDSDGSPLGSGCLFVLEENPKGMKCFLKGPPSLKYHQESGGYKIDLKTQQCFRGSVALGQGKIGGDINFDVSFVPSFCDGDFCIDKTDVNWNVVPGTARFALKESSVLNGVVKKTINNQIGQVLSEAIRIPLSKSQGPLSQIPLAPEGRVDRGPGYFGACLKFKEK